MRAIADYATLLGEELLGVAVRVRFVHSTGNFLACYGGRKQPPRGTAPTPVFRASFSYSM
jgi:hypothetical protein